MNILITVVSFMLIFMWPVIIWVGVITLVTHPLIMLGLGAIGLIALSTLV